MQRTPRNWTLVPLLTLVLAIGFGAGCGDSAADGPNEDDCKNGICSGDGDGDGDSDGGAASGGAGGSGAGGGSASGGAGGAGAGGASASGGAGGTGGSGSCVESWVCSPWSTNGTNDDGTRTCTDQNACGTTLSKPIESATLPALDLGAYKCEVEPVLDWGCAMLGCHGTEQGRALRTYARGRLRITGDSLSNAGICLQPGNAPPTPSEDCTGSVECECWVNPHLPSEWRANYDAARGFALDAAGQPLSDMATSELLQQPLVGGNFAHAGIHMLVTDDARYTAIKDWLESAGTSTTCGGPQANN